MNFEQNCIDVEVALLSKEIKKKLIKKEYFVLTTLEKGLQ